MAKNNLMNMMGEIIGVADVMFADTSANDNSPTQANGSITINLGVAESGEGTSQQAEIWGTPGIISVPAILTSANNNQDSAQCLYFSRNDQNIAFAFRDTRTQTLAGNMNPGETVVYAPGSQARVVLKNDGSVSLITTDDGTATGNIMQISITPTTGITFSTPWGTLTLGPAGFNVTTVSGANFNMGGTPDPTTGGSGVSINAGMFTAGCGGVNLGLPPYMPAIASIIPVAVPGVPILGTGVGAVTVMATASPVNISIG